MRGTPRLIGALLLASVVLFYGATSQVAWLLLLSYWVLALVLVGYFYARWNWRGLTGSIKLARATPGPGSPIETIPDAFLHSAPLPAPIFEGDHVEVELALHTTGAARGPARLSGSAAGTEMAVATGRVPRSGWSEFKSLGPVARGPLGAEDWTLEAGDPLGFFKARSHAPDAEVALVLPLFRSLTNEPRVRELEASLAAPRAGAGTELFGVREYRRGDPLRRIHWRSSARHGELVVREYEPPGVQTLGIFLSAAPLDREIADQIARIAASEAWDCIRSGGRVVVWAPGLEPSRQDEVRSLWAILEWLARYPDGTPSDDDVAPRVGDAVAVVGGSDPELVAVLQTVRSGGGTVHAWVVGEGGFDIEAPVQGVGTQWPL